ncbi:MAG: outer membrane beta-barrel protein [Paludibacteraceae bacterium]|nr:outer membrane beta-barrel protein [Paludibacteraceae bacterium]
MRIRVKLYILLFLSVAVALCARAQGRPYLCEIGVQGGCGYYVGEAAPHIFMNPREAYGIQLRYKFTKRWALSAHAYGQRIAGHKYLFEPNRNPTKLDEMWSNRIWSGDIVAEFNFFRYDAANKYDKRIKPYTPYIFAGLGGSMYYKNENKKDFTLAGFIPVGVGFKWKFAPRWGLNIAWQHNIYFSDDIEAQTDELHSLNNRFHMNGSNWLNCDVTGVLTVGIIFEFAKSKAPCRICNDD